MNHKDIGTISEAFILAKLLELGKKVLMPFGDNSRYDLVIEENNKFIRVQCKTAWIDNNCIVFKTCSSNKRIKGRTYKGEADIFIVYCPINKKYYSLKVIDAPKTHVMLRLQKSINKSKNSNIADNYELK